MYYIGIDIGSTAAKVVVMENDEIKENFTMPTGWSCVETSENILKTLNEKGYTKETSKIVGTGYGRVSIPYADKTVTEITCHGLGAYYLYGEDCTVIDIGGQDTKIISLQDGMVADFIMNDKCSAGTGRFLEVMANILGVKINDLIELSKGGKDTKITSMCTVFAESEVISLIGRGEKRENIAYGVVNSVIERVGQLCKKHDRNNVFFLTGGLCGNDYVLVLLREFLQGEVYSNKEFSRYAGAIGAAITAKRIKNR